MFTFFDFAEPLSNATPILSSFHQTMRQRRSVRPPSKLKSNVGGIPIGLATLKQAPVAVRLRTVQSIVEACPSNMILAPFNTRVRRP